MYKKRVSKEEIGISEVPGNIISHTKGKAKPVDTLGCKFCEIMIPELSIIIPAFILCLACKGPVYASNTHCRFLNNGIRNLHSLRYFNTAIQAVGQFQQRISKAPRIVTACK